LEKPWSDVGEGLRIGLSGNRSDLAAEVFPWPITAFVGGDGRCGEPYATKVAVIVELVAPGSFLESTGNIVGPGRAGSADNVALFI
jgi:hypothetical protein